MEQIEQGGVTTPKGFAAASVAAGLKYEGREDMALLYSAEPLVSAGTYTKNVVKAAPVVWDRRITEGDAPVRAVVVNAGLANACTGEEGDRVCRETAAAASEALGIPEGSVLLASTGVIGQQIPIDKICFGVSQMAKSLKETEEAAHAAARAIMTTDTHPKEVSFRFNIDGKD